MSERGFTLIEMTMVVLVIGLLLGAMSGPLLAQREAGQLAETRAALKEIREALIGFALAQGRLPCPADPAQTGVNAGKETLVNGQCTRSGGALPWQDLGIAELDAWGSRYRYQVTPDFADTSNLSLAGCAGPAPVGISFALCSPGGIIVRDSQWPIALNIPAVIVSHGPNRHGAFDHQGQQLAGATDDEAENSNDDAVLVSASRIDGVYDDLTEWLPVSLLASRMVAAGRLP